MDKTVLESIQINQIKLKSPNNEDKAPKHLKIPPEPNQDCAPYPRLSFTTIISTNT
jgi:hypothetical protein